MPPCIVARATTYLLHATNTIQRTIFITITLSAVTRSLLLYVPASPVLAVVLLRLFWRLRMAWRRRDVTFWRRGGARRASFVRAIAALLLRVRWQQTARGILALAVRRVDKDGRFSVAPR